MEELHKMEELIKRIEELEAKVERLMESVFPEPDPAHFKEKSK
jgi:hypothetical protein